MDGFQAYWTVSMPKHLCFAGVCFEGVASRLAVRGN